MSKAMSKRNAIVSSAHLAKSGPPGLSELEYGLIVAQGAFSRWTVRCMSAAGWPDLSHLDVLVLHSVHHRGREKRAADICFVLGVEDAHTVTYALKKLVRLGLVERARRGKEAFFGVSPAGSEACAKYAQVRETCLLASLETMGVDVTGKSTDALEEAASRLRALSGLYEQAARAAASL